MGIIDPHYIIAQIEGLEAPKPPKPPEAPKKKLPRWICWLLGLFQIWAVLLFSTQVVYTQSDSLTRLEAKGILDAVGPLLSIVDKLVPNKENSKAISMVKANGKKGCLIKRYNRWMKRGKLTAYQFDLLTAELLGIDVKVLRVMKK